MVTVSKVKIHKSKVDPKFICDLRSKLEIELNDKCLGDRDIAFNITEIFFKLDIGDFSLYECKCKHISGMSDAEVLKRSGF